MDALSDVLKLVRLEGAVFLNAEFTAPWCISSRFGPQCIGERLSASEQVLYFHFLTEGRCKLRLAGGSEVLDVAAGDLVLFPRDVPHLLGSDLQRAPIESAGLMTGSAAGDGAQGVPLYQLRHGGGGAATRFVCGYLACNRSTCRLLLGALPDVVHVPAGHGPAAGLLRELFQFAVRESLDARPGAQSMLAKISELMFVDALRRYAEALPAGRKGWLAGMRDPKVGRALALLHRDPARSWTVDDLAREAALSRSALAERFAAIVGEPPMQYLARWRLARAAHDLRSARDTVIQVAQSAGYESETAFSRAFKREFGLPPVAWRKAGPPPS